MVIDEHYNDDDGWDDDDDNYPFCLYLWLNMIHYTHKGCDTFKLQWSRQGKAKREQTSN